MENASGKIIDVIVDLEKVQAIADYLVNESAYSWTEEGNQKENYRELIRSFDMVANFLRIIYDYTDKIHDDLASLKDSLEKEELANWRKQKEADQEAQK